MKRFLFSCVALVFMCLSAVTASAQAVGVFDCPISQGVNFTQGGNANGTYGAYWCAPKNKYGEWRMQVIVVRPSMLSAAQVTKLQTAAAVGDSATMLASRTHSVQSAELKAVWAPDAAKLAAAAPPAIWRVQSYGTATTRAAYDIAADGTLGQRSVFSATVGTACKCDEPTRRVEKAGSLYCVFTPEGLREPAMRTVTLCSNAKG